MRKLLKYIAPKSFNDGLARCNDLGKRLIRGGGVERFLDVGCGEGGLTMEFAKAANAREIFGIEYIPDLCRAAEEKGIRCIRQDLNTRWDIESDRFDLVLSSQNIEHLHNSRLYLEECYRTLKPRRATHRSHRELVILGEYRRASLWLATVFNHEHQWLEHRKSPHLACGPASR